MATELDKSIKSVAARVAQYVDDVATLTLETHYVHLSGDGDASFDRARPVARTTIKLDGDCDLVVPMREAEASRFEVDAALLEVHQQNVASAIEYRARILNALLGALPPRSRA